MLLRKCCSYDTFHFFHSWDGFLYCPRVGYQNIVKIIQAVQSSITSKRKKSDSRLRYKFHLVVINVGGNTLFRKNIFTHQINIINHFSLKIFRETSSELAPPCCIASLWQHQMVYVEACLSIFANCHMLQDVISKCRTLSGIICLLGGFISF